MMAGLQHSVIRRAQAGDPEAQEAILRATRGMVMTLANRYGSAAYPAEDLVQDGQLGLLLALPRYELGREASFTTWAYTWIRGGMLHALRDRGRLIHIPCHAWEAGMEGPIAVPIPETEDGDAWEPPAPLDGLPLDERLIVQEALDRLPARRRAWLLRMVCYGESGAAIGREAGVSHNFVYREVRQALTDLRRWLG